MTSSFDLIEVSPHEVVTTFRTPPDLAEASIEELHDSVASQDLRLLATPVAVTVGFPDCPRNSRSLWNGAGSSKRELTSSLLGCVPRVV